MPNEEFEESWDNIPGWSTPVVDKPGDKLIDLLNGLIRGDKSSIETFGVQVIKMVVRMARSRMNLAHNYAPKIFI